VNIALLLDLAADTFGDRVALTDDSGDRTFAGLRSLARSVGPLLAADGAGTLAFADAGSAAVPTALFGAAWAGVTYAPLNFRLPASSLATQLERLDAPWAVVSEELAGRLDHPARRSTARWMATVTAAAGGDDGGGGDYEPEPGRPAVILFTSGSSGVPKAALLTHENLLSYVMETVEFAGADDDEALMLAAPPFHIAGVAAVLSSVYAGRRILPLAGFDPEGWLRRAREQRATHAFVVPTMLARIVRTMAADPDLRVPTLRALSYGGARIALPVLEQALELFPSVDFVNAYGLTETSSTIAVLGPEEHRLAMASTDPDVRRRLHSAGRPLPGVEVAIVGDDGVAAGVGITGQIRVRGPQVSGRYLDSASGLDDAGWLVTGDVGSLDGDGYLFVESRADDVIIKGGENLSPSEIEDVLLRHGRVVAAAVVGIPDPEWGETVAAAVVVEAGSGSADPTATAEELTAWVRDHLGSFKAPVRVELLEELPTTPTGKVLRRSVRDQLSGA
jgi:acyl-CoA synthetase (AMP-forming)/AMP-acid ligase II